MNQQFRKTLLCQHERHALCIYHCLMSVIAKQKIHCSGSIIIFSHAQWQSLLCKYLHVSVSMCHIYVCLLPHCTTLHSYQQMLPKSPALSRLMNQRQVPEGKHVHCHMSSSSMAAFSMHHMPQSMEAYTYVYLHMQTHH